MIKLNGFQIVPTIFPDGTSQVWHLPENLIKNELVNTVTWDFSSEADFLHLAQLKDLMDTRGYAYAQLHIEYLPYARQDKFISNDATFALYTFARLLNSLRFDEVTIMDPHSKEALRFIHNSSAVYPIEQVMKIANILEADLFCYPDNGAYTKYTGFPNIQNEVYDYPCTYGEKVRDQSTGHILSYKLTGNIKDKKVLIVDDICDGGGTFILLAKQLLEGGAKECNLFVTHGLFTKGLKPLHDAGINKIYTKDGEIFMYQNIITYRRL